MLSTHHAQAEGLESTSPCLLLVASHWLPSGRRLSDILPESSRLQQLRKEEGTRVAVTGDAA